MLSFDLVTLERGQAAQRQVEDRLGLRLRKPEALHQTGARRLRVGGTSYQLDYRVQIAQRDEQAFEDMQPRICLAYLELRAARLHPPARVAWSLQRGRA